MARKVQVHLIDDVDGSMADETVKFSLDGNQYEIDLGTGNAEKLRAGLAKYIVAGRRATAGIATGSRKSATSPAPAGRRNQSQTIREWAKGAGIELSDRGRIPASVVERFEKDTAQ